MLIWSRTVRGHDHFGVVERVADKWLSGSAGFIIILSGCTRKPNYISVTGPWEQISSLWFPCLCVCREGGMVCWVCVSMSEFLCECLLCHLTASATNSQAVCLWCPPIIVSSSHFIASTQFYFTVHRSVGDRVYTLWNVQQLIHFQNTGEYKVFWNQRCTIIIYVFEVLYSPLKYFSTVLFHIFVILHRIPKWFKLYTNAK